MRQYMFAAIVLASMGVSYARPIVIEESAVLTPPPGITYARFGDEVGTNGEYALVLGQRPSTGPYSDVTQFDALLYRRVNGNWVFQRILATGARDLGEDWSYFPAHIGMKDNLASAILGETYSEIFRYNGTDWVPAGNGAGLQEDVSIDGERILYGVGDSWNGRVYEPNGSGGWVSYSLPGQIRCCDDEYWGGPVDLLGDRAILGTPYTYDLEPQEIPVYQRSASGAGWQLLVRLQVPDGAGQLGGEVVLHGGNAIVDYNRGGPFIWNSSNYFSSPVGRLQSVNAFARGGTNYLFAKDGNLLLMSRLDPDLHFAVIDVFRPDATGRYQHVAILKPKGATGASGDTTGINGTLEIDGNTVIAGSNQRALMFTLPSSFTAPTRYDRFEGGNGGNWTPSAGAQFTVVRPTKVNGVYRQSNTTGDAHSVFANTNWVNQSIEADIRPISFNGSDRWVGLATRYADNQNYYYVTLRSSGSVQLKRMRAGVFTTLASAPLVVQTHRTYRVRLESLGQLHRVYVDGALLLTADEPGPQAAGSAAVITSRAAADFDNVIASSSPRATLFADDFTGTAISGAWTYNGSGQWSIASNTFSQGSVAAEARALIGTATTDQVVSARVRPVAFAASPNGQERWVGLLARYADVSNYYYLTLRSSNTLSLRKLVNGAITELGSVPVTVTPGTWYSLRLEVVVTTLRVYLGDTLVMQVLDSSHAQGTTGLMTNKAAAQFDDYSAYQP